MLVTTTDQEGTIRPGHCAFLPILLAIATSSALLIAANLDLSKHLQIESIASVLYLTLPTTVALVYQLASFYEDY